MESRLSRSVCCQMLFLSRNAMMLLMVALVQSVCPFGEGLGGDVDGHGSSAGGVTKIFRSNETLRMRGRADQVPLPLTLTHISFFFTRRGPPSIKEGLDRVLLAPSSLLPLYPYPPPRINNPWDLLGIDPKQHYYHLIRPFFSHTTPTLYVFPPSHGQLHRL